MEANRRGLKKEYVCKLCSKVFSSGRSLGGHMRSHLNISTHYHREKLQHVFNGSFEAAAGYGLRENRRKTWRISDLIQETSLLTHTEKAEEEEEEVEELWTNSNDQAEIVMDDGQSDNDTLAPTSRKRSRRGRHNSRYMSSSTNAKSSPCSPFLVNNSKKNKKKENSSPSVCGNDQEQEEVAISLMMLSRDHHHVGCFDSLTESSYNTSIVEASSSSSPSHSFRTKTTTSSNTLPINGKKLMKFGDLNPSKQLLETKASSKLSKIDEKMKKDSELVVVEVGKNTIDREKSKRTIIDNVLDSKELGTNSHKKRSKFECSTCKKSFHSYQALGGHRASHRKVKDCSVSITELRSENYSLETELSHMAPMTDNSNKIISSKMIRRHKCPVCFKVFASGQALGGHKRSHLLFGLNGIEEVDEVPKPVSEIRDFIDLNLPAPSVDEESNDEHLASSFKTWWIGNGHIKKDLAPFGV